MPTSLYQQWPQLLLHRYGLGLQPNESLPASALPNAHVYETQPSDTITSIARRFSVSLKAIVAANRLNSTRLTVGQKILIPVE